VPGTHSIPRLLVLGAGERPPQALLAIGHKAQGQLLGHQALHQTFRAGEIFSCGRAARGSIAPVPSAGFRTWDVPFPLLAERLPVPFQSSPDRSRLCRRFHDHFLDLLFEQPLGQQSQLGGVAAKPAPLKGVAVDFDLRDEHAQRPFMNVNSCYPIRHKLLLLAAAASVPSVTLSRVAGYRLSH
jgi:hypothetical protein